jgi:hypothetical protein
VHSFAYIFPAYAFPGSLSVRTSGRATLLSWLWCGVGSRFMTPYQIFAPPFTTTAYHHSLTAIILRDNVSINET